MTTDKHRETARELLKGYGFSFAPGLAVADNLALAIASLCATTEADAYARAKADAAEIARLELAQQGQDLGLGSAKTAQLQGSIARAILADSGPSLEERIAKAVGALPVVYLERHGMPGTRAAYVNRDDVLAAISGGEK